jgi:hypothetical protein
MQLHRARAALHPPFLDEARELSVAGSRMPLVLTGQGHKVSRKYKFHLAVRPVEHPPTLRDDYRSFPEYEACFAKAFIHCG